MMPLETERLIIRNWQERDRDLFHEINSDPEVMEFFPFRRNRAQSDSMMDRLHHHIESRGIGFAALELKATGQTIGFAGLHLDGENIFPPGTIEIGWRLALPHWGKGYVTEAGRELLRWGFEDLALTEIVCFAVDGNHRSTAVMDRLGFHRRPDRDFDHPQVGDDHPHLKRHVFYDLTREDWLAQQR